MTPDPKTENCVATRHVLFHRGVQPPDVAWPGRLLPWRRKPAADVIPDWHPWGNRLMEAIREGCALRGWDAMTGPWPWYEPDFRLHAEVDALVVILSAVVPYHFGEGGFVSLCRAPDDGVAPEATARKVLDVVRSVLTDALDAVDVREIDQDAPDEDWPAFWQAHRRPVR